MASEHDANMQELARYQLAYILQFKSENPEQDELPELVHDMLAVTPYLEQVAAGRAAFNEEAINARVNKNFFAAEYDLEELRGASFSAAAPSPWRPAPEPHLTTSTTATIDSSSDCASDVVTTVARGTPAADSVEIAYQKAFARLDAGLRAQEECLSDIYSDDSAGASPKTLPELEAVHSNDSKVSKVTQTALAFLSQTDMGHIIEARAQSSSQSISSREAEHGTPSKDSTTRNVESISVGAASPAPTTHLHRDEVDEGLISFDEDPTPVGTISTTIADVFPPKSTFAKEWEEAESSNVALDTSPTNDHAVESEPEPPVKTSEVVPFSPDGTTSAPDDECTVPAKPQCASVSITGDNTFAPASSVHEDSNVVKCFKCGNDSVENVITCSCKHQYCADCLNDVVKTSVHGPTPFPPVCCEIPIPVDINSCIFDEKTLYDFLGKKFAASDVGEQGSIGEWGNKSLPSPQSLPSLPCTPTTGSAPFTPSTPSVPSPPSLSAEDKTEYSFNGFGEEAINKEDTKCHVCHNTIEKGLYCPDCCYQCNNSRADCKCDWWDGRQRREKDMAIVKAPTFQTARPQVAPFRGQKKQFGGIFERKTGTHRAEIQNGACQHPLMKQVKLSGRCFDCHHMLPTFLWQCTRCKYSVCKHCGMKRGIFSH
ncbi:hypothetical protein H9Q69_007039 [Fusarium xylarioides]|uniref:RING-type domain-containing protein n=1 Tax=Fusarium xylarioides TaxID=221167 RepID=A0A9P7IMX9_9HYPO|nr:hypothetical protein H9Q70_007091 [Fusarium xylarioides]KAG5761973.1 hypothetical protein H9Q72_009937 [Fusarium xylarioides]KAG5779390.1 hypothetical protein H9Q73_006933 [Fusarium xylarioides]KAG5793922.1 hypothetical protein H9Q69_007039 [Fusarium xylarioides]KAG5806857.1 hypothetical protein H9Q71_008555 [Fusarium xylarioides]